MTKSFLLTNHSTILNATHITRVKWRFIPTQNNTTPFELRIEMVNSATPLIFTYPNLTSFTKDLTLIFQSLGMDTQNVSQISNDLYHERLTTIPAKT